MKKLLIFAILAITLFSCSEPEDYLVIIHTEHGDMKAVLFDETPLHKQKLY